MDEFEILGIERTSNTKSIKRAYAKKLRQIDLETEPEKYQKLRTAYDHALTSTKYEGEIIERGALHEQTDLLSTVTKQTPTYTEQIADFDEPDLIDLEGPAVTTEPSFNMLLSDFLAQGVYYYDSISWRVFLTSFVESPLKDFMKMQQEMKFFLQQSYDILSDDVRIAIIQSAQLEEEWRDIADEHFFKNKILKRNSLDFSFYEQIPIEERADYFKLRGVLYKVLFIEENNNHRSLVGSELMNEIYQLPYQDDDLFFLIACAYLWEDRQQMTTYYSFITGQCLEKIKGEKYQAEVYYLNKYLEAIVYKKNNQISRNVFFNLKWLPYSLKKKLSMDLGSTTITPQTVMTEKKPVLKTLFEKKEYSIVFNMFVIIGICLLIAGIGTMIDNIDEQKDSNELTEVLASQNRELLNSTLRVRRYLTADNKLTVLIADPAHENQFLKKVYNRDNELETSEWITSEEALDNNQFGTFDTLAFFLEDLASINDGKESYLGVLSEVGQDYFSEDGMQEYIDKLTERQLKKMSGFTLSNGYLIQDKTILVLNPDERSLYLELDEENKIDKIYGEGFRHAPEIFLLMSMDILASPFESNPWNSLLEQQDEAN